MSDRPLSVEQFLEKYVEADRIKFLGAEMKADLEEMMFLNLKEGYRQGVKDVMEIKGAPMIIRDGK